MGRRGRRRKDPRHRLVMMAVLPTSARQPEMTPISIAASPAIRPRIATFLHAVAAKLMLRK